MVIGLPCSKCDWISQVSKATENNSLRFSQKTSQKTGIVFSKHTKTENNRQKSRLFRSVYTLQLSFNWELTWWELSRLLSFTLEQQRHSVLRTAPSTMESNNCVKMVTSLRVSIISFVDTGVSHLLWWQYLLTYFTT